VAVGDSVGVGEGGSASAALGEAFLFRCREAVGLWLGVAGGGELSSGPGVGEAFFFRRGETLGVGKGDSAFATDARFFVGETPGVGDGDSSRAGDCFFFADGDGVGRGDFFGEVIVFFFLCGGGVGVEKIFLRVLPNDCSAASATGPATQMHNAKIRARISM